MIKATFKFSKTAIINFKITGHAESKNINGNDLVCAGVSAIVFGILNSLESEFVEIELLENLVEINVIKYNIRNKIILDTLFTSIKTIEEVNKKNIKLILERE